MAYSVEQALDYLLRAHRGDRLPHAFLFSGPEGSGKRKLVSQFFQAINGERAALSDLHSIEPESKSRRIVVDQIRELEGSLRMRSSQATSKFGVIYDADRMMPQAGNAFLKTLEEPPAHSILVLVTSLPGALLETIVSRCIQVPLRLLTNRELTPEETALLEAVTTMVQEQGFAVSCALQLAGILQKALQDSKERIEAEHDALLKKDQAAYKQATDGTWLVQREERLAVLTESRYQQARTNLVLRIIEWFGDAIRIQQSGSALDLPIYRRQATNLAQRSPTSELLKRLDGLQSLVDYFSKNIQERMAIEVAFLRAFGPRLEIPVRQ
jgi:DNA polymerase III subunit delta'